MHSDSLKKSLQFPFTFARYLVKSFVAMRYDYCYVTDGTDLCGAEPTYVGSAQQFRQGAPAPRQLLRSAAEGRWRVNRKHVPWFSRVS